MATVASLHPPLYRRRFFGGGGKVLALAAVAGLGALAVANRTSAMASYSNAQRTLRLALSANQSDERSRPGVMAIEPDAHGRAALLLAESILHALVDTSVLTNAEAVSVVNNASDVKREVATTAGESTGGMQQSLDELMRMTASFETDDAMPRPATELHFPRLV